MSELLNQQVHAQKENFWGSASSMKKCAMKMKQETRKKRAHKNYIHGRKPFIMPM